MRDADRQRALASAALTSIAPRPEGEPHLTFETLLTDTLQEMAADEESVEVPPDAVTSLCDDAVAAMRAEGTAPLARPFHHSYLTPIGTPTFPSRPSRLDVRS
jgi:hypothetical protein